MDRKTLEQLAEYHLSLAEKETDPEKREWRFKVACIYFEKHAESYLDRPTVETIMGDKIDGGKYEISGQAGSVGPQSTTEGSVFAQVSGRDGVDLKRLASELAVLVATLKERATQPEAQAAINKVQDAQQASEQGDETRAVEALSGAGTLALSTAREVGAQVATNAMSRSMIKVATELELAHIMPWAQLGHKAYLEETKEIDGLLPDRIWSHIEQYGICLIRLLNQPPEATVLENIVKLIGFPAEDQNDFSGAIKDINPAAEGRANSGDTTSELGFHVDGTQDPDQPALLAFQYVRGAKFGANSRFADSAGILMDFDERTREEILVTLARSDAATFSKLGMEYTGPIFSFSPMGSLMCRVRFDSVIQVHDDCKESFELLRQRFESSYYPSMYLPRDGDVVVFDNWRIMHARDEIYGPVQRHHRRVWISMPRHEHQLAYQLGIRPFSKEVAAAINAANKRT